MKYAKPPLTLEQQAELLLSRGMRGDRATMIDRLAVVNYYRLSGYWHPFRNSGDDTFRPNTTFTNVWQRYAFDRRLRLLVIDAIERIEVAVRRDWPTGWPARAAIRSPTPRTRRRCPT